MVHGILRHMVCGGQVGHPGIVLVTVLHSIVRHVRKGGRPGIVLECLGNCGTRDTTHDIPGIHLRMVCLFG